MTGKDTQAKDAQPTQPTPLEGDSPSNNGAQPTDGPQAVSTAGNGCSSRQRNCYQYFHLSSIGSFD